MKPIGITCDWALRLTVEYSSQEICSRCGKKRIVKGWILPKGVGLAVEQFKREKEQTTWKND